MQSQIPDGLDAFARAGRIDISDPVKLARWAKAFDVSAPILCKAVQIVGPSLIELNRLFPPH